MSRSYKKPYITDQNSGNPRCFSAKRAANKVLRNANKKACQQELDHECANGKSYRKHSESWNIRDWSFYAPENKKAKRK